MKMVRSAATDDKTGEVNEIKIRNEPEKTVNRVSDLNEIRITAC